jgi:DNA repair exonuclease SbcCD ATPase subunit
MRNLKFKYAKAINFLCFGEEGVEVNFEELGNIVCIKGKNLDVNNEDGTMASNGSGKSSIPEIIVYALFGKTIKKPKKLSHPDIINNKSGNTLMVELIWDKYRLVRTRSADNKGTLRLWESEEGVWNKKTEISMGGLPTTQKELEKKIGLTYEAFINIFIFSDDNTLPFLECDSPTKREIVENLLSLEKYRNYSQSAKDLLKNLKDKIKELTKEYESLDSQKEAVTLRVTQIERQEKDWYDSRQRELDNLLNDIKRKRDELDQCKTGEALAAYQEAQEEIAELKLKIPDMEGQRDRLNEVIGELTPKIGIAEEKLKKCELQVKETKTVFQEHEKAINDNKKIIEDIKKKSGKACPYCLSVIDESKFASIVANAQAILASEQPLFDEAKSKYDEAKSNYDHFVNLKQKIDKGITDHRAKLGKVNSEISDVHCQITNLAKKEKPDADVTALRICDQLEVLKSQANDKQSQINGATPFVGIKQTAFADLAQKIKDCDDKKEETKASEKEVSYYEFWVKAFGDVGIRKYVIDGIIPTLNDRIEYWLQFLIDNKIKLTFDNELQETIDRYPFNGRPYIYHGMSGGQRRRLNLTVAAAWAFISTLNSGASPSAIFLDEVTMNMDIVGIQGIYRMICELAKEKQVFVIDHNETLLQMLDGCDTIDLEMQDEISTKAVETLDSKLITEKFSS